MTAVELVPTTLDRWPDVTTLLGGNDPAGS